MSNKELIENLEGAEILGSNKHGLLVEKDGQLYEIISTFGLHHETTELETSEFKGEPESW